MSVGPPRKRNRSMIKSELIQRIATRNEHLYHRDVETIVSTILDEITAALARGDRVELRGFGAFSVKRREARTGRNPRTGEQVSVQQKNVPFFKTARRCASASTRTIRAESSLTDAGVGRASRRSRTGTERQKEP